jgi:DNA-binding MarR family transcriptional regulator
MQLNGTQSQHNETLESLLVSATRLTRLGARITGNTVSSAAWSALAVLIADGPHRVGDLARSARISQPGMTKVVNNLVADEWVVRVADVEDSRAWLIAVTDTGRAALAERRRQLADALASTFIDLTDDEWSTLDRAAGILAAHTKSALTNHQKNKEEAA